jgi:PAS domain S-box-containing protein
MLQKPPIPPPFSMARRFLLIFLPLIAVLVIAGGLHFFADYEKARVARESSESLNVELARKMIVADIDAVITDVLFLGRYVESQSTTPQYSRTHLKRIGEMFLHFAQQKRMYDQVRMLDVSGHEIVRVNFNGGSPQIIAATQLQKKSQRYYFREATKLESGQVYISPLDLNIEDGELQTPYKPMMRFATPVFDLTGKRKGIVVLNYFGERLINHFRLAAANIADHIELLNEDGYWLSSQHPGEAWGFMFDNGLKYADRYPLEWKYLQEYDHDQIYTDRGLFTFATLSPTSTARRVIELRPDATVEISDPLQSPGITWKIVAHLPPSAFGASVTDFIEQHQLLYGSMLLLLLVVAVLLAKARHRYHWAELLHEYERRFRRTLEDIELAAISVDRKGTATFCNDHFLAITGWQRDEIEGQDWIERCVPETEQPVVRDILRQIDHPLALPNHYELTVLDHQGNGHLISWNNTLSYDAEGRVSGVTAIGEDITEQRQNEEELRKLSRAVEQSPSIVMITNRQGIIEYVNPKFTEVTGYNADEVIGKNPNILKSDEKDPQEYLALWQTLERGEEWRGEFHNRKKNGELFWESASISVIRDNDGEITHYLALKEDITRRKTLEQTVVERNRELADAQALAVMGRMASMVAHDLRNPLSSIKMGWQILGKKYAKDRDVRELRDIAQEQIHYMEDILTDLLTYSRPDAIRLEWLSIDRLLDSTLGLIQKRIDDVGVAVETNYAAGLPTLPGDPNKLRQAFSNLILNAAQATECNPLKARHIKVETSLHLGDTGTAIHVRICDNGCGLDPDSIDRFFEPFYTTRAKGTGLGLTIVKQIAMQHGGEVYLSLNEAKGTCAEFILPTRAAGELAAVVEQA